MGSREQTTELIDRMEQDIKALEIAFEQYFLGMEKRSPEQLRQKVAQRMRRLLNSYIPQLDLRFRLQSLSSRFNSYAGHWDRTQRLIDEGKYERHTSRIQRSTSMSKAAEESIQASPLADPVDNLYEKLVDAHESCHLRPPDREQVAKFLAKQQAAIRERFGGRQIDYDVVVEGGKPKIKVRAKR